MKKVEAKSDKFAVGTRVVVRGATIHGHPNPIRHPRQSEYHGVVEGHPYTDQEKFPDRPDLWGIWIELDNIGFVLINGTHREEIVTERAHADNLKEKP